MPPYFLLKMVYIWSASECCEKCVCKVNPTVMTPLFPRRLPLSQAPFIHMSTPTYAGLLIRYWAVNMGPLPHNCFRSTLWMDRFSSVSYQTFPWSCHGVNVHVVKEDDQNHLCRTDVLCQNSIVAAKDA